MTSEVQAKERQRNPGTAPLSFALMESQSENKEVQAEELAQAETFQKKVQFGKRRPSSW